ncbi:MAG: type VI secretion system-associated protein TagF [Alcanivorax sp.]|nr:type VI secretion system-associated protein TagF [Alcanivorax sp.]
MFGFLKQGKPVRENGEEKPVISAFGKLPIRADFIKHRVDDREIRELDQWIQEGYALISRRLNGTQNAPGFPQASVHHAVFAGTDNRRTVLATIAPGSDRSGRWYPFVIATIARPPSVKQVQAAVPLVYGPFFRHANDVVSQRWRQEPLENLLGCLDAVAEDSVARGRSAMVERELGLLRATSLEVMEALAAEFADDPAVFHQGVIELISAVIRRGPARTAWGIRLPLPAGDDAEAILVFWLRLMDSLMGQSWSGSYFWRKRDAAPGYVTIFFRTVPPSFLPHLFDEQLRDGTVQHLTQLLADPAKPSRKAIDVAALQQGTLLDLLSRYVSGGQL